MAGTGGQDKPEWGVNMNRNLHLTDIFNTRNWEIQSDNSIYKLNNYSKSETRIFWIGLTYNFNSFKSTKSQKNGDGENDGGIIKLGQ